jgi:hypothetical protein
MQLDALLVNKTADLSAASHGVVFVSGRVEADKDAEYVPLYREPTNPRAYLLVRKADVMGELHAWTADELAHAGHVGVELHRVPIAHGAQVQAITVKLHRLGESISGAVRTGVKPLVTGGCYYDSDGCSPANCCTVGSDGECYCDDCCVAYRAAPV